MAWIELHQTLPRHPKLIRLAARLGVPRAQAAGHLTFLWLWVLDYAPTGDLSAFGPAEISAAADFGGDADAFAQALRETGWLDEGMQVHDWQEYAGRLLDGRVKARERMREFRKRERSAKVRARSRNTPERSSTLPERSELPYRTVPYQEDTHSSARDPGSVWPTKDEVLTVASMRGIPPECASKWWLENDARGGLDARGQPITRWQSSLQAYAVSWRANDQKAAAAAQRQPNGSKPHPETRQIPETIPIPLIHVP